MLSSAPERRIVFALAMFIAAVVCYTAWRLTFPSPVVPGLKEAYLLEKSIQDRIDTDFNNAQALSREGRHKEAAYVLLDLSGMQSSLARTGAGMVNNPRTATTQPSSMEFAALLEFTIAGPEFRAAFVRLLEEKYPTWKMTK